MKRMLLVAPLAGLAIALAACQGGVADETGSPLATGSPAAPSASASTEPTTEPTTEPSPDETATPEVEATPGETRTIPFEPAGMPELNGEITLTEMGSSTQVTIEFDNAELPATAAEARLLVGSCDGSNQVAGELEITSSGVEGLVPIRLESILALPHSIAIYESDDADEPVACADLPTA